MANALTRRAVARYVAEQLISNADTSAVMQQLAAYLIDNGKIKQTASYVTDIETELAVHGVVVADVTTARPLGDMNDSLRRSIEQLISTQTGGRHVALREHIDKDIIGGIIIRTAGKEYDRSLKGAVRALRSV
ncbi:MAG: F0F1 ATP synthase subunit delta [Candidatus Saccharimonadales bacterium]